MLPIIGIINPSGNSKKIKPTKRNTVYQAIKTLGPQNSVSLYRLGFSSIDIINSPNDPAFKRRRCSIFVEVTDLFYCLQTQVRTRPASDLKRLLYHRFRYFKVFWKFSWCNLNPLFVDECFQILNLRKLLSK